MSHQVSRPETSYLTGTSPSKLNTVLAVGKSILNRGNKLDIGALMLEYGGGGHLNAGTCQVPHQDAEALVTTIARAVNEGNL